MSKKLTVLLTFVVIVLLSVVMLYFFRTELFSNVSPQLTAQVLSPPAPGEANMLCIPVQQLSPQKTHVECRFEADSEVELNVAEFVVPFSVNQLLKVSSPYSSVIGMLETPAISDPTATIIYFSAVDWQGSTSTPLRQDIPLNQLSFIAETSHSMGELQTLIIRPYAMFALDSNNTDLIEIPVHSTLSIDTTLLSEAFIRHEEPRTLQFLGLGEDCYGQTSNDCLINLRNRIGIGR